MKLVEDSCLLPEAGRNHALSFLLLITFRLRISLMVILAPQGELLVSVNANVGVELLATTLADKLMANAGPLCISTM